MVITMKPADHIKLLRRWNELSRGRSASASHSATRGPRTQSPSQTSAVACLENKKKICCEVINNIQITLLIQVFLKPKYTLVPGLSVKMSASSMAHMQMQVVVSVLFIKRWIIVLRTWRLKTERLSCSGLAAECLKNINKLNHLNL